VTPTPDAPPAAHFDVEQAPYAESECSDKYPCNDDAAGWEVASRVSTWAVRRCAAGSFGLIDGWDATDDVVIVDAMRSGAPYVSPVARLALVSLLC